MKTIHDSGYKVLFSNKEIFRQLLETFVQEDWIKELDFDHCETIDKSFISEHYKQTESDIIYRVRFKDKELYIIILIEFQSTVDRFMALRILNYLTNFYTDYLKSNRQVSYLPPVFPILLYNGDRKWNAPQKISELIENHEILGAYCPQFEYFKIAENEYSKEELLEIGNIVSILFLAESYYDLDLLKQKFLELFEQAEDKKAISLFLNWFKQLSVHRRVVVKDYQELEKIYKDAEEVKEMLIKAIELERNKIYQEGIKESNILIAKMMLSNNEPFKKIMKYTNLSKAELLKLKDELSG